MNSYDAGDAIRLVGTFTNAAGALADPTTVRLHLIPPVQLGAVVPGTAQVTPTAQAVGSYTYDILPLPAGTPGVWTYAFVGTGDVNAVFVGQFFVRHP